jgi:hypothetical protein
MFFLPLDAMFYFFLPLDAMFYLKFGSSFFAMWRPRHFTSRWWQACSSLFRSSSLGFILKGHRSENADRIPIGIQSG